MCDTWHRNMYIKETEGGINDRQPYWLQQYDN